MQVTTRRMSFLMFGTVIVIILLLRRIQLQKNSDKTLISTDRRKDKARLRLVTFNAEWLFHFGGQGIIKCPGPTCVWKTSAQSMVHLRRVAFLLLALEADIIHLCEVEGQEVLDLLLSTMRQYRPDHGYRAYITTPSMDKFTGQNVALLTRIDPCINYGGIWRSNQRATCQSLASSVGVSKHYFAWIKPEGEDWPPLLLVGLHLLARPDEPQRGLIREAQAKLIRGVIDEELTKNIKNSNISSQARVIVMGDLNDLDEKCPGADGNKPISNVTTPLRNSNFIYLFKTLKLLKGDNREGPGKFLFNTACLIENQVDRFTSWHDTNRDCVDSGPVEHSMIDHILVSNELLLEFKITALAFHDYEISCALDRPSDHWPMIVEFKKNSA